MRAYEHWTRSRQVLVVTAEPETLQDLAQELSISDPQIVSVSQGRAALPLRGRALKEYLQLEKSGWLDLGVRAADLEDWNKTHGLGSRGTVVDFF